MKGRRQGGGGGRKCQCYGALRAAQHARGSELPKGGASAAIAPVRGVITAKQASCRYATLCAASEKAAAQGQERCRWRRPCAASQFRASRLVFRTHDGRNA